MISYFCSGVTRAMTACSFTACSRLSGGIAINAEPLSTRVGSSRSPICTPTAPATSLLSPVMILIDTPSSFAFFTAVYADGLIGSVNARAPRNSRSCSSSGEMPAVPGGRTFFARAIVRSPAFPFSESQAASAARSGSGSDGERWMTSSGAPRTIITVCCMVTDQHRVHAALRIKRYLGEALRWGAF